MVGIKTINGLDASGGGMDSNAKLLLRGDGPRFVDSSANNYPISYAGQACPSPTQKKFGDKSLYFDGTGDYLTVPDSDDWAYGTGDFTIDFWIRPDTGASSWTAIDQGAGGGDGMGIYRDNSISRMYFYYGHNAAPQAQYTYDWTPTDATWYHLAFVRNGSNWYHFRDGVYITPTVVNQAISTNNLGNITGNLYIGYGQYHTYYLAGYIDELRISKGIARWTTNFTPPTLPYAATAIPGFISNYPPAYSTTYVKATTTRTGYSYSSYAATNPGSLLTGTSDGTSWESDTGNPTNQRFHIDLGSAKTVTKIYYENFHHSGTASDQGMRAFVLQGSNDAGAFAELTYATDTNWTNLTTDITEMVQHPASDIVDPHYIVVTNTTAYRYYAFKVSTNWGSATYMGVRRIELQIGTTYAGIDSYTKLLLHGEDGFLDSLPTPKIATPYGDVKESNLPCKFGNSSAYFDGTGDYLSVPLSADWNMGAGDFTTDFWIYLSASGAQYFFGDFNADGNDGSIIFYITAANKLGLGGYCTDASPYWIASTTTISTGTWYHVAGVRNGATLSLYINGVSEATANLSTKTIKDNITTALFIGKTNYGAYLNGYIDELRISKGIARWTSDFSGSLPSASYTTDSYTKLLLHGDGVGQIFQDSSTTPKAVTAFGDTRMAVARFGSGALYFDGTGDYLSTPAVADFNFAAGDFTVDFWIRLGAIGANQYFLGDLNAGASDRSWLFYINTSNQLFFVTKDTGGTDRDVRSTTVFAANIWYHIAAVRNGTNLYLFVNGISEAASGSTPSIGTAAIKNFVAANLGIGRPGDYAGNYLNGYIDELRITKGQARFPANFTPPTAAYTDDSSVGGIDNYTRLLLNFEGTDPTVVDSSLAALPVFNQGGVTQSATQYKFGTKGGYFNGANYLQIPHEGGHFFFGAGDFTIDCWLQFTATPAVNGIMGQGADGNNSWLWGYSSDFSGLTFSHSDASTQRASYRYTWAPTLNTWYHVALVRSGTNLYLFIDGVSKTWTTVNTAISTNTLGAIASPLVVGKSDYYLGCFTGYLDSVRISKGIARWTAAFTPPTGPYTIYAGGIDDYTKLLLHGDGSGQTIVDSARVPKTVTVVGNTTQSATQSKFGDKSIYFDGNGDYLTALDSDDWSFGAGDFTIDFWFWSGASGNKGFCGQGPDGNNCWQFSIYSGKIYFYAAMGGLPKAYYNYAWTYNNSQWYHIALVRSGTSLFLFIDGVSQTLTVTYAIGTNDLGNVAAVFNIGYAPYDDVYLNGYMEEFRVSKGVARWTANFIPPSAAYSPPTVKTVNGLAIASVKTWNGLA